MEHDHSAEAIRKRLASGPRMSYLRDWIYGGIDGAVTTFAIVFGVIGANLGTGIILVFRTDKGPILHSSYVCGI